MVKYNWKSLYSRCNEIAKRFKIPRIRKGEFWYVNRIVREVFANKQDQIIMVEGDRGVGKSYAGMRLAECIQVYLIALGLKKEIDERFSMAFDSREFAMVVGDYDSLDFCDVRFFDEPGLSETSHLRSLTKEGALIATAVQGWRFKQQILVMAIPSDRKMNIGLREFATYLLMPPTPKWKRYVPRRFRSGRGKNIDKRKKESIWDVKTCEFDPESNKAIRKWIREKNPRTGQTERSQFLILRHPNKRWVDMYEKRKPQDLAAVFRRKYEELKWVKQESEEEVKKPENEDDW